ncbi:hypothetical protein M427DRAFT_66478 [Gonapodya prolifera JEL478]|uniref:Uncharacterized protein n=1 Tax=Gonapodya prolifera (strain JEL478) TaxID=1344416 RepID=A0A139AUV0_GONPJ|nr:hypothetical protein M427DRAFT_66478 [Gonapodya prolifera JEL478]|eukprot:KXS20487.1 hypothetical protein M427DRAFT_66478 [Gonapodya prolifera JEL478]
MRVRSLSHGDAERLVGVVDPGGRGLGWSSSEDGTGMRRSASASDEMEWAGDGMDGEDGDDGVGMEGIDGIGGMAAPTGNHAHTLLHTLSTLTSLRAWTPWSPSSLSPPRNGLAPHAKSPLTPALQRAPRQHAQKEKKTRALNEFTAKVTVVANPSPSATFITATSFVDEPLISSTPPPVVEYRQFAICPTCQETFRACLDHCMGSQRPLALTLEHSLEKNTTTETPKQDAPSTSSRTEVPRSPDQSATASHPPLRPLTLPLPPILPHLHPSSTPSQSPTSEPPFFRILRDPTPPTPPPRLQDALLVKSQAGVARVGGGKAQWTDVVPAWGGWKREKPTGGGDRWASPRAVPPVPSTRKPIIPTTVPAQSPPPTKHALQHSSGAVHSIPPADLDHLFAHFVELSSPPPYPVWSSASSSSPSQSATPPRAPPPFFAHLTPYLTSHRRLARLLALRQKQVLAASHLAAGLRARLAEAQTRAARAEEDVGEGEKTMHEEVSGLGRAYARLVGAAVVCEEARRQVRQFMMGGWGSVDRPDTSNYLSETLPLSITYCPPSLQPPTLHQALRRQAGLQSHITSQQRLLTHLASRIATTRRAVQEANRAYVAADARVGHLRRDAARGSEVLRARAEATAKVAHALEMELGELQAKVERVKAEEERLDGIVKAMVVRVDQAGERRDILRAARAAGEDALRVRRGQIARDKDETARLVKETARLVRDARATVDAMDVAVVDLKGKVDRCAGEVEAATAGKRDGEAQVKVLMEDNAKVASRVEEARRSTKRAEEERERWEDDHEKWKVEMDDKAEGMKRACVKCEESARESEVQRRKFTKEADGLHGKVDKQLAEATSVTNEHAALIRGTREREEELKKEVDKVVQVTAKQIADREEVGRKLKVVEGELEAAKGRADEARRVAAKERGRMEQEEKEMGERLREAEEDERYMGRIVKGLEEDDEEWSREGADVQGTVEEYELKVERLVGLVQEQERELARSSAACEDLEASCEALVAKIADKERGLREATEAADETTQRLAEVRAVNAAAGDEGAAKVSGLRLDVAEMGGRVVGLEVDRAALLRRIARLRADVDTCRTELSKDVARSEKLRGRIHDVRMACWEDTRVAEEFGALKWRVETRTESRTMENWAWVRWRERRGEALERTVGAEFRRMDELCDALEVAWGMWGEAKEEMEREERRVAGAIWDGWDGEDEEWDDDAGVGVGVGV